MSALSSEVEHHGAPRQSLFEKDRIAHIAPVKLAARRRGVPLAPLSVRFKVQPHNQRPSFAQAAAQGGTNKAGCTRDQNAGTGDGNVCQRGIWAGGRHVSFFLQTETKLERVGARFRRGQPRKQVWLVGMVAQSCKKNLPGQLELS